MKYVDVIDPNTLPSEWHRNGCPNSRFDSGRYCDCARVARILLARLPKTPVVEVTYVTPITENGVVDRVREHCMDDDTDANGDPLPRFTVAAQCDCHYHRQQRNIRHLKYADDCVCERCRDARGRRNERENTKNRVNAGLEEEKKFFRRPSNNATKQSTKRDDPANAALAALLFG